MLQKTSGIILNATKYSESSLIVKLITPDFGIRSYIVSGVHSKKTKLKANLFQPFALVDLVVKHNEKSGLQRISEITINYHYSDIPFNIIKSTIVLFLHEIVYKSVKEQHPDKDMFEFIQNSLQLLDLEEENCANFHLYFMLQLSRYLGFYPENNFSAITPNFELQEGRFVNAQLYHFHAIDSTLSMLLNDFINADYKTYNKIQLTKHQRKQLLQTVITYYQLHINSLGEIKSNEILEQVIG